MNSSEEKKYQQFRELSRKSASPAYDPVGAELCEQIKPWIDRGDVLVERGNQHYFDLIEQRFPISVNRIAWHLVALHKETQLQPSDAPIATHDLVEELKEWLNEWHVPLSSSVRCVGDNTKVAFHLSINSLFEILDILRDAPQHTYVLPPDGEWCIQLTFEGYACGGLAKHASKAGE